MKISKHSDTFFDAIQCMKQCVDFPLLLLAISTLYLTVLPLSTLFSVNAKIASGALEGISEIDSIIKFVFLTDIPMGFLPIYTLVLIVFGVLTAFLAFGFLVNKKKSNVIFSLGLTRARIFANRLRTAAAFLAAAVILPLTITLFANFAIVGVSAEAVKAYFALLTAFLTCEAIGLSVGILSATIMSNFFEGVLSAGSMLAFPSILILFAENVFNSFLEAYPARLKNPEMLFGGGYDNLGLFGKLSAFNPLNLYDTWQSSSQGLLSECGYSVSSEAFILKAPGQLFSNPKSNVPPELFICSLGWLAVSAIIILFARKCFKKRSMESTSKFGGSRAVNRTVRTLLMLSASLLVLFVLSGQHEEIKLFAMLFCSIAVGILCIAITLRRKKEIKKELLPLAVQILAVAALPMLCFLFSSSYASYIPDASQVKYAAISIPYSSEHMYRLGSNYASRTYINNEHMPKTHLPSSMFGFSSQEDIAAVIKAHTELTKNEKFDGLSYDVPVAYMMEDGSTVIRMFKNVNSASIEALMELNDTDAVKNRAIEYLTGKTDEKKTPHELISFMRNELPEWMTSKTSIGHGEKRKLLVVRGRTEVEVSRFSEQFDENTIKMLAAAIAKDITGMSAEEVFAPSSLPLGTIMLEGDCTSDGRKTPEREALECDIYESMENTVSLLRELGIYETLAQKSETVSVRLYPLSDVLMFFDYPRASEAVQGSGGVVNMLLFFNSNNDSASRTPSRTITDKAEIEALESAMRCSWYIAGTSGQIAECTFANGHIGTYYIPDEK